MSIARLGLAASTSAALAARPCAAQLLAAARPCAPACASALAVGVAALGLRRASALFRQPARAFSTSRPAAFPLPAYKAAEIREKEIHDGGHLHVSPYLPPNMDWNKVDLVTRVAPEGASDWAAKGVVKFLRFWADLLFSKRYGHRAIVLETVAGVPGFVSAMINHLRSLRYIQHDNNHIQTMLDEAENERMHLMVFMEIARPNLFERGLVMAVQAVFTSLYIFLYAFFPKTCHRFVGYLEEEAVVSYTQYLNEIDAGRIKNIPAPKARPRPRPYFFYHGQLQPCLTPSTQIAIDYWSLPADATLREVVVATRADEVNHRDVNHYIADEILERRAAAKGDQGHGHTHA
eukprot:tig00000178_g12746.t1